MMDRQISFALQDSFANDKMKAKVLILVHDTRSSLAILIKEVY